MGSARYTSKQTNEWLRSTMKKLGIASLDELSTLTKIDRGSLSRYFNQDRRPSIDAIVPICTALGVTSDELLIVLGAAPATAAATIGWTCSGLRGSASVTVKTTLGTGAIVYSNTFTAACFGDAVNYTAALDKASYVPGDIAVLTITATDSSKNAANDQEVMGTASTAVVAIAGSNMTSITAPTNADTFTSGKKTYKFIVGSSEGSYQMSVDLPKFNSATYSQAAVTAAYKIAASSATVSNADVLKSIVALIASINKQIQALQKLILARR